MQVHHIIPYRVDKDLGKAYNEACALVPIGDWICLRDYDTMFLTPDAGKILHDYASRGEECLYTCYTNRCHETSAQLCKDMQHVTDIKLHIKRAGEMTSGLLKISGNISGFLMMFPKSLWVKYPFKEGIGCLGVDTAYWQTLAKNNVPMYIITGLYVFHIYRLMNNSKEHLL